MMGKVMKSDFDKEKEAKRGGEGEKGEKEKLENP
jgi:hypothetical protein